MRALIVLPIVLLAALLPSAHGQPGPQVVETSPLPIVPPDMVHYCVHESRVYSLGSGLCFGRLGYVCVPSNGPATGNRAYWTGKDDQIFTRPVCN